VTFWQHFFRVLCHKPLPALGAMYWQVTRRRVRARNRLRVASADLPFAYDAWITTNEPKQPLSSDAIDSLRWKPKFAVVVHSTSGQDKELVERSVASVERQIYPKRRIIERSGVTFENLSLGEIDFVLPLRAGDVLSESGLLRFAEALQDTPDQAIIYGDEDQIDRRGRRSNPWFKPEWNEELFLAQDYLSSAAAIPATLVRTAESKGYHHLDALLLYATSEATTIVHVPHVVVHVSSSYKPREDRFEAVGRYLEPKGATCTPGPFGTVKVEWPLPEQLPLVSIIVPTRDRLELLRPCVEGVLHRTTYESFELLVVDNESAEAETKKYFREIRSDPRVRIVRFPGPYNFSTMNNFAVRAAKGSYVCLLNNDTEVIEPVWLTEMMRYATRNEVGAVGAKLLYDDGSIQHAGVIIGLGEAAGHAHRFLPANDPGYFRQPHVTQFMSAVTAACLVIDKSKFLAVGGLDEGLAVAFNDVDLCLKLQKAGLRNVYVPHAVLVHHESKTRGSDTAPAQFDRYLRELHVLQERWQTKTYRDPLHNPNLDRYTETFVIRL
jgi:GT2 family glycosyltransferase